ncbi:GTP cyclohydrolase I [Polynucleobacter sphagniphilus]|uniref:GTP cyclohydrolase I n=1 Tax=Polynucleobacter sphagniphilus TaxID=1743169 RepID=UPI002474DFBD|nr:GTP cyclohydrolase I [Polynucleobacter sphagniphilus]MDH6303145.1 GTP cyclohydrolase I [Polynucleobacter sphagniphilus]
MPTTKTASQKTPTKLSVKKVSAKVTAKVTSKATPKVTTKTSDAGTPLSVVIRRRIEAKKARFNANDNISAFIQPGELDGLVDEVAQKMQAVLESLVIDTKSDHNTQNTSRRVAKMFVKEVFNGRYVEQPVLTKFPNVSRLNELMIIGPITVRSACSHHLCPIMGRIWIGVLPSKESALIGLSKYSRLTEWVMCRPQIQEEAVVELADMLEKKIKPIGVAIVMDADHFCMQWRGVKDRDSKMVNSVMRGAFLKDSNLRRAFLSLLDKR